MTQGATQDNGPDNKVSQCAADIATPFPGGRDKTVSLLRIGCCVPAQLAPAMVLALIITMCPTQTLLVAGGRPDRQVRGTIRTAGARAVKCLKSSGQAGCPDAQLQPKEH